MDLKERYLVLLKSIREILKNEDQMHMSFIRKRMNVLLDECIQLEKDIAKEKEWEVGGSGLTEEEKQEINNSLLELKSKIDNQDKKIDENSSHIDENTNLLNARMDTFTKLEEGSTTADAELKDIRVGADGTTYENAGEAVRKQFCDVKESIKETINSHYNLNYGYGTMPITISETTGLWFINVQAKSIIYTLKLGIERVNNFSGRFVIRMSIYSEGKVLKSIDKTIPTDITQNDIELKFDFSEEDLSESTRIQLSAFFIDSGTLTIKYIGLFEGDINCDSYKNNAKYMYIKDYYDKGEIDDLIKLSNKKASNELENYIDTTDFKLQLSNPLFNLFKFGNRNIVIDIVGDSTSDGDGGPSGYIYERLGYHSKSGELLEGAIINDRGSNGSQIYWFLTSDVYKQCINDNADLYIICYGLNDIRLGARTKEEIKTDLITVVNKFLESEKSHVLLRVPNSYSYTSDFSKEKAQEYSTILHEIYLEISNLWSKDRVQLFDTQKLIFGTECVALEDNELLKDDTHPNAEGQRIIADFIAELCGEYEKPQKRYCKLLENKYEKPYLNYPLFLDYYKKSKVTFKNIIFGYLTKSFFILYDITKEEFNINNGDIIRFGNILCKEYNGENIITHQNKNCIVYIAFTDDEISLLKNNIWHISVWRINDN